MTGALNQPDSRRVLRLWRDTSGDGVVVHVAGEVDLVTAPALADELTEVSAVAAPPGVVVIDLTGVTFLASAGLSVLLEQHRRCRDRGLELRVVPGNRTVARTIDVIGLGNVLTVRDSIDAALEPTRL